MDGETRDRLLALLTRIPDESLDRASFVVGPMIWRELIEDELAAVEAHARELVKWQFAEHTGGRDAVALKAAALAYEGHLARLRLALDRDQDTPATLCGRPVLVDRNARWNWDAKVVFQ